MSERRACGLLGIARSTLNYELRLPAKDAPALRHVLEDYQSLPEYSGVTITDLNKLRLFGDHPINVAATRGSIDELGVLLANGETPEFLARLLDEREIAELLASLAPGSHDAGAP